ncbi:reverse transcriptase-like protein [Cucumis melo var. makuwa]|nr:reverse transcriptase-like protein [Cucumis melo var. makuwa]
MDSGTTPCPDSATVITLIPKHCRVECMEDFRPIYCCNVIYKCISKILADRLRMKLPSFISGNQSAFVPKRSILDNILLCQELDFLFALLTSIGTPLRPSQSFQFHQHCEKAFADDLMIFCAADDSSLRFVHKTLRKFGELLSLFENLLEKLYAWAGVASEVASHLTDNMCFTLGHLHVLYLGLPLLSSRLWLTIVLLLSSVLLAESILGRIFRGGRRRVEGKLRYFKDSLVVLGQFGFSVGGLVKAYILKERSLWSVDCGGGSILERVGKGVHYDATGQREARLSEFIPDGEWRRSRVSIEMIDFWYQSLSFRFCRLTYDVSLCFVSLWLKRSLPLVREMPPRRGARRGGRGGRGRGAGRVQPEVQPIAQATDPAAPVTHADLATME